MKNKLFKVTIILSLLLMTLIPLAVNAETSGTCGDNLTWILDDNGTLTISGTGDMWNYTYDSRPFWIGNVKNAIIQEGVTSIGSYAFGFCENLESVSIPDGVTTIGGYAFRCVRGLTDIVIPDSVKTIDGTAFYACYDLKSITMGTGVTDIGCEAFYSCDDLESVHIKDLDAWCKIKFDPFYGNPLMYAGNLYLNGELVEKVVFPDDITEIQPAVFSGCTSILSVTIPDNVTKIERSAFKRCSSLLKVNISSNLEVIDEFAFNYCSSLSNITIPSSVTYIGLGAFRDCPNLQKVYITDIAKWCNIEFDSYSGHPLGEGADLYLNKKILEDLIVPDTVSEIKRYTFYNCDSIKNVTISNNVTFLGNMAFYKCDNIKNIYISDIESWCNIERESSGNLLRKEAILYLNGTPLETLIIPETIKNINKYTFANCTSIKNIIIPNSITSIETTAFYGCINLKNVYITDINTWCEIEFANDSANPLCSGGNLYLDNELVKKLEIPDTVTKINPFAFYNCKSIESLIISECVERVEDSAFYGCSNLKYIVIPESVWYIKNNVFYNCNNINTVFYCSDELLWEDILIYTGNDNLTNANIMYNSLMKEKYLTSYPSKNTFVVFPTNLPTKAQLLFAGYNGNLFLKLQTAFNNNEPIIFDIDSDFKNVKVMVWDNLETRVPLCEAENVPLN